LVGIPLSFDTQDDRNFIKGEDGGIYYLDTPEEKFPGKWNLKLIMEFMENSKDGTGKQKFSEKDKRIVEKAIKKIQAIKKSS